LIPLPLLAGSAATNAQSLRLNFLSSRQKYAYFEFIECENK